MISSADHDKQIMTIDDTMTKNKVFMISSLDHNLRRHDDEEKSSRPKQFAREAMS
jgi:hypothetical protein